MEGWLRNLETAADIIYMHVSSDGGARPRETSLKWQLLQIYKQHTQDNSPEQPGLDETAANGDGATDQSGLKRDVIENKRWWWSIIFHFRLESFGNFPPPLCLFFFCSSSFPFYRGDCGVNQEEGWRQIHIDERVSLWRCWEHSRWKQREHGQP